MGKRLPGDGGKQEHNTITNRRLGWRKEEEEEEEEEEQDDLNRAKFNTPSESNLLFLDVLVEMRVFVRIVLLVIGGHVRVSGSSLRLHALHVGVINIVVAIGPAIVVDLVVVR